MRISPLPLEKLHPAVERAAWAPVSGERFDAKWAAHLYRRAGFGYTPAELKGAVESGLDSTLNKMFARPDKPPPKAPALENPNLPAAAIQIRAEWLQRMLSGTEPIRERMTLFWHNHFATSIAKIQDAELMRRQNDLIRQHALGKFGPFLREMSRDAAMLIWLDSNQNVKEHPNENYAREVMELFSLGVGNYNEKDVQEAARAFTGWHVAAANLGERRYVFRESDHDGGQKTFLGQTGNWNGDDIIRILLEQPACARFLVRKLYAFFINENGSPTDAFLQPLVDQLKKSDYDIAATVKTMLKSQHFFSTAAYRQKMKSPIDYCLGVARLFGTGSTGSVVISPYSLINALELQGQQLYKPPNVKGWEGGKSWLNTATVLARHNFAYAICNGMKQLNEDAAKLTGQHFVPAVDPLALHRRERIQEPSKIVELYGKLLFPDDLKPEVAKKLTAYIEKDNPPNFVFEQRCRDAMYAMLTLPEYQLC